MSRPISELSVFGIVWRVVASLLFLYLLAVFIISPTFFILMLSMLSSSPQ
jgi:hypothetical protein